MPLITRRFPKLPGRRPLTPKTIYVHLSPGVLDIFGTDPDNKATVVNVLLPAHLEPVALLRAADNALLKSGYEVIGGWRLPLRSDSGLIATAAVRVIPPLAPPAEYADPHP